MAEAFPERPVLPVVGAKVATPKVAVSIELVTSKDAKLVSTDNLAPVVVMSTTSITEKGEALVRVQDAPRRRRP